jgi:hypothetical protein
MLRHSSKRPTQDLSTESNNTWPRSLIPVEDLYFSDGRVSTMFAKQLLSKFTPSYSAYLPEVLQLLTPCGDWPRSIVSDADSEL